MSPIHKLQRRAHEILDTQGRLKGHFYFLKRRDEIGDLSHSLMNLTQRLSKHMEFVENFASVVSHEFKNPLASIRSATELSLEIKNHQERNSFLHLVLKDVAKLEHILNGVREISLLDLSPATPVNEQINLVEITESCIESFKLLKNSKDITFSLIHDNPPLARINPIHFSQIILNLLENSVSFSKQQGKIDIQMENKDNVLVIKIIDDGPGIEAGIKDKIFERFFSQRGGQKDKIHTGLGLSIVKVIAEKYQGTIRANNAAGRGAGFILRLPLGVNIGLQRLDQEPAVE